jgi:hypothetical protein
MAKTLQSPSVGMIIRQKEPTNLETPLDQIGREKGTSLISTVWKQRCLEDMHVKACCRRLRG